MVDESLTAYLKSTIKPTDEEQFDNNMKNLLAENEENSFSKEENIMIVNAIDKMKILDPACGSGAFPMGILLRMVHILNKVDKDNIQ
jgi:type II restriction/modification system DNA methylase subunit YeeA